MSVTRCDKEVPTVHATMLGMTKSIPLTLATPLSAQQLDFMKLAFLAPWGSWVLGASVRSMHTKITSNMFGERLCDGVIDSDRGWRGVQSSINSVDGIDSTSYHYCQNLRPVGYAYLHSCCHSPRRGRDPCHLSTPSAYSSVSVHADLLKQCATIAWLDRSR